MRVTSRVMLMGLNIPFCITSSTQALIQEKSSAFRINALPLRSSCYLLLYKASDPCHTRTLLCGCFVCVFRDSSETTILHIHRQPINIKYIHPQFHWAMYLGILDLDI